MTGDGDGLTKVYTGFCTALATCVGDVASSISSSSSSSWSASSSSCMRLSGGGADITDEGESRRECADFKSEMHCSRYRMYSIEAW